MTSGSESKHVEFTAKTFIEWISDSNSKEVPRHTNVDRDYNIAVFAGQERTQRNHNKTKIKGHEVGLSSKSHGRYTNLDF